MKVSKRIITLILVCFALSSNALSAISHPITIMTLNLANYNDHIYWEQRLQLIVEAIEKSNADVIALQETRYDPDHSSSTASHQDMAQQILYQLNLRGEYLQAQLVTQPIMYYPHGTNGKLGTHNFPLPAFLAADAETYYWEGISIISRLPILETGSVFLSKPNGCDDDNKRATQYIKVNKEGESFYIANIHLSGSKCFRTQLIETSNYLKQFSQENLFIVGDFNAVPTDPSFKFFTALGLVDVWNKLRPGEKGYTVTAEHPYKRIDYVWVSSKLGSAFTSSKQINVIADEAKNALYPSDHLGLVANMQSNKDIYE